MSQNPSEQSTPARRHALDRRGFLGVAGGSAALLCGLGGHPITQRTVAEVAQADTAARSLTKPASATSDPIDTAQFQTPAPQPGGQKREYWIAAHSTMWNIAPTGRDEWMNHPITGKRKFRALVYQLYSDGFASAIGPASMPGPTLEAEVGDTIVVHFRNADEHFGQAHTVHPHGVRYNPEYDGAYLGRFTRAGGFIAPGEEFTYTWEATPDSVGVWPYHDHGPNHTLNMMRGLFGAVVVRPKGTAPADVEQVLVMHSFMPQVTGFDTAVQCFNGRVAAGNTPTIRARVGQQVALHVYGGDMNFHTFHVHGHRWKDPSGAFVDCPTVGPNEALTARWTEDNPGRWLYHCHVAAHQDFGMAGWYIVEQ
jgi:FtsP/CotA-like multicopper oxidase with cupredoxin domain